MIVLGLVLCVLLKMEKWLSIRCRKNLGSSRTDAPPGGAKLAARRRRWQCRGSACCDWASVECQ